MNDRAFHIFHPNFKGTGSALRIALRPADEIMRGHVCLDIVPQRSVDGIEGEGKTFPTFSWGDGKISLRLDAMDVGKVLSVLRGYEESIADGKGLVHLKTDKTARLTLEHVVDPTPAYRLTAVCAKDGEAEKKVGILLTPNEALVLEAALTSSMGRICFGD